MLDHTHVIHYTCQITQALLREEEKKTQKLREVTEQHAMILTHVWLGFHLLFWFFLIYFFLAS